mgnify:CR=1 FL=1
MDQPNPVELPQKDVQGPMVIVIEEHVPEGGLSSRTKQIAWDIHASCELHCFTLKDAFIHRYGGHDDLLAAHGISVKDILRKIG